MKKNNKYQRRYNDETLNDKNKEEVDNEMEYVSEITEATIEFVLIAMAANYSIPYLYNPFIRLILHFIAGVVLVRFLTLISRCVGHICQRLIEIWLWVFANSRNKQFIKKIRKVNACLVGLAILVLPGIFYGSYCYAWEHTQALDFQREIQYYQLIADFCGIIFSINFTRLHSKSWYFPRLYYTESEAWEILQDVWEFIRDDLVYNCRKLKILRYAYFALIIAIPLLEIFSMIGVFKILEYATFANLS